MDEEARPKVLWIKDLEALCNLRMILTDSRGPDDPVSMSQKAKIKRAEQENEFREKEILNIF